MPNPKIPQFNLKEIPYCDHCGIENDKLFGVEITSIEGVTINICRYCLTSMLSKLRDIEESHNMKVAYTWIKSRG